MVKIRPSGSGARGGAGKFKSGGGGKPGTGSGTGRGNAGYNTNRTGYNSSRNKPYSGTLAGTPETGREGMEALMAGATPRRRRRMILLRKVSHLASLSFGKLALCLRLLMP